MSHEAAQTHWDAIVIGTGIGGGTMGRALAEAGQKVLFLEQGAAGFRSETNGLSDIFVPQARHVRGLWPTPLHVTLDGKSHSFYAPLGSGVGGSSAFYAATLERPERHDLENTSRFAHPTGGWPVGYDAFAPFFAKAAQMYRVYGDPDPLSDEPPMSLRAPPRMNATETSLMTSLSSAGLHPYHAHTGLENLPGCQKCLGTKCPRPCKMDGRSAGVEPALATGNATLIPNAQVVRITANASSVTSVDTRLGTDLHSFRANRFILAGGALGSPRLLLASASEQWPNGLANHSGLVGRNLMFHLNEMFALWPKSGDAQDGATKAISLRDFYTKDDQRLGTVQSMGIRASYGEIVFYLNQMLARSPLASMPGLKPLTRLPAALAHQILGSAQLFVGLMEDMPYPENHVLYDSSRPDHLAVSYHLSDELKHRRRLFRRALKSGLKGHRKLFLSQAPELNYGHASGTLRFGEDSADSVLTPQCRAHDLDNLWVTDASFMPTSMGVNPSLTIAANALRVANAILKERT